MFTSSSASPIVRCLVLLAVAILLTPAMRAQMPPSSSTTSTPVPGVGHNYLGELVESVNPANGSLSIRITPTIPPGRGLTLPFSFAYDSSGMNYVVPYGGAGALTWGLPSSTIVSTGGWSETVPVVSASELNWTATTDAGTREPCYAFVNYVYQDANGNRHNLNVSTYKGNNPNDACTYDTAHWPRSFSGEFVTQGGEDGYSPLQGAVIASIPAGNGAGVSVGPVSVTEPDGTSLYFPNGAADDGFGTLTSGAEDRNGNVIQITPTSSGGYSYTDTLGRTVLQDSGFATSGETVTISGLNASYKLQWAPLSTPTFDAPVTTLTGVCGNYFGHVGWNQNGNQNGISTLTLPNLKSFSFKYDSTYGVVNRVTYPTGGYVRYVWGLWDNAEWGVSQNPELITQCAATYAVPVITDRYVSFDGSTEVLHQQFAYQPPAWTYGPNGNAHWTTRQTIVITTDNVRHTSYNTTYTYSPSPVVAPPNTWGAPTASDPVEQSIAYNDTTGTLLQTVYKTWANPRLLLSQETQYPSGQADETTWSYNSRDLQIERDDYDFGTSGVGSRLRKTITNYQAFNNASWIVDRPCQIITYDSTGTNRVAETDYFYDNGATTTACGAAGTPSVTGAGGSTLTGHDDVGYSASSTTQRGNVTQKTQWLNTGSSSPATTYSYDETGQILTMTDPNLNQTSYAYGDSFLNTNSSGFTTTAGSPPSGMVTNAYLTKVTYPTTNGVAHIEQFWYGYNDGELTQSSDQNSPPQLTKYKYNDSLGRLTETDYPDTGTTTSYYNDSTYSASTPSPSVTVTKAITSSVNLETTTAFDGLGHPWETILSSDPDGPTYTQTSYDGVGHAFTVSNPYRTTSDLSYGITTYIYDGVGRTCLVVPPDFAASAPTSCPTTAPVGDTFSSYGGNQTTVTDEVGNQRKNQTDGLGRLTAVWEAPNASGYNYETQYQYDALNNLLCAVQKGTDTTQFTTCAAASATWRPRSFAYDSLSRLTTATNPESGTLTYTYDANGNVTTRVEPKANTPGSTAVTTSTYTYDPLNRLLSKVHADPISANSYYGYDGTAISYCPGPVPPTITSPTNLVGRRSAMCANMSASNWSYDPMGRPLVEARTNVGPPIDKLNVSYTYYKDGSLNTLTYPSGDLLTYIVGGAGRPLTATDSTNNYVTAATYAPHGALTGMTNGTGIVTTNIYSDRLQPIQLSASVSTTSIFSLCYDFHLRVAVSTSQCAFGASTIGDNGNVFQILNKVDPTRSSAFIYDPLNRIAQAYTVNTSSPNCWGETYSPTATAGGVLPSTPGIDAWGNLTNRSGVSGMAGGCTTEGLSATATTQNQLGGIGLVYDPAGNVVNDGSGNTPTYDAENRIVTDVGVTYSYDADGVRINKSSGTMYWPGPGGETLTEATLTGVINEEYVYFNGERIARVDRPSGKVNYYFSDKLGSASVIAGASGTVQEQYFYYPYGYMQSSTGSDPNHYKFTGKERDSESGLDNFGARYNASTIGRFMTPDWAAKPTTVPYAKFGDPQSLNLYSYARNNPTSLYDPDGHCWQWATAICNFGQSLNNAANGLGFHTNAQVEDILHKDNQLIRKNGLNPEGLKDKQVYKLGLALGVTRPSAAQARAIWEKATGQKVAFDEKLGRFYDMQHKTAIADGGNPRDPNNLTPMQHDEHMAEHINNRDFQRWGARANQTQTPGEPTPGEQLENQMNAQRPIDEVNDDPNGGPGPD